MVWVVGGVVGFKLFREGIVIIGGERSGEWAGFGRVRFIWRVLRFGVISKWVLMFI